MKAFKYRNMGKLFPDFINDQLFLKRKFTEEEKLILDNLINKILNKDPKSLVTQNTIGEGDPFPGSNQGRLSLDSSEHILKEFIYKKIKFRVFFVKIYPENIKGPIKDQIRMIAFSPIFDNLSYDGIFDTYLKYDQNNKLTSASKKEIENEICKQVINSIEKVVKNK